MNPDKITKTILDGNISELSRIDLEKTLLSFIKKERKELIIKKDQKVSSHVSKLLNTDKPSEFHLAAASDILQGVDLYSEQKPDTKIFKDIEKVEETKKEINEVNCSICLDNIRNEDLSITNCMHFFHSKCITNWIKQFDAKTADAACPNCRQTLILLPSEQKKKPTIRHVCSSIGQRRQTDNPFRLSIYNSSRLEEKKISDDDMKNNIIAYEEWSRQNKWFIHSRYSDWNRRGGLSSDYSNDFKIQRKYYSFHNKFINVSRMSSLSINRRRENLFATLPSAIALTKNIGHIHRICFRWSSQDEKECNTNMLGILKYCHHCTHPYKPKEKVTMFFDPKLKEIYTLHSACASTASNTIPRRIKLREKAFQCCLLKNSLLDWQSMIGSSIICHIDRKGYVKIHRIMITLRQYSNSLRMKRLLKRGN